MQVTLEYIISELKEEEFINDLLTFLKVGWKLTLKVSFLISLLLWLVGIYLWNTIKTVSTSFSNYIRDVKLRLYLVVKEGDSKWSKGVANWLYIDVVGKEWGDYKVNLVISQPNENNLTTSSNSKLEATKCKVDS